MDVVDALWAQALKVAAMTVTSARAYKNFNSRTLQKTLQKPDHSDSL